MDLMIDRKDFSLLRMELAIALFDAAGCDAWPWCTDPDGCYDLYVLLEKVGLNVTRESVGEVEYVHTSIAPFEVSGVLEAIFTMAELGNLQSRDVLANIEVTVEMVDLLGQNEGAWIDELSKIGGSSHRTVSQQKSVIQFVYELLEIALPDSYLAQLPAFNDSFDEDSEDHFTSNTSFDDSGFEVFQDPSALNVEERIVLIDNLWVPEWSASLPKASRRVIGLVLAAIDGRPYAAPFVPNINRRNTPAIGWPIEIEKAFGVTELDAKVAIHGAWGIVNGRLNSEFTPPFYFDT